MVKYIVIYRNFSNLGNICKWPYFDKLSDTNDEITKFLTNLSPNLFFFKFLFFRSGVKESEISIYKLIELIEFPFGNWPHVEPRETWNCSKKLPNKQLSVTYRLSVSPLAVFQ